MSVSPYFQLLGPRSCLWRGDQALGSLDISEFPKILSQHAIHSATREVSPIPSLLYQKSNPALLVGNQTYTKTLHCSIILFPRLNLHTYQLHVRRCQQTLNASFSKTTLTKFLKFCQRTLLIMIFVKNCWRGQN